MGITAAIGSVVGGLGSELLGSNASQNAADTQANAANQAAQTQLQMYNQTRSDLAPYNTQGQNALSTLAGLYGLGTSGGANGQTAANLNSYITSLPGYQFQQQQGEQGIQRNAAANGTLMSGGTLKALDQYNQGLAGTYYGNYINQLSQMAGLGESAASQTGNYATQTGQNVGNSLENAGAASAAGQIGSANAWSSGVGGGINNALTLYAMNPSAFKLS